MKVTDEKIWSVYMHVVPKDISGYENNKYYIGITSKVPQKRWNNGKGYKTQLFYRAITKYKWENIVHIILKENLTHKEACNEEKLLIKKYNSNNKKYGYNLTSGGEGICGYKRNKEQIKKMSDFMKGKYVGDKKSQLWKS